jgi:hypothetical protein
MLANALRGKVNGNRNVNGNGTARTSRAAMAKQNARASVA